MFESFVSLFVIVVQFLALVWALMLLVRLVFGFGLNDDGELTVSNRRGKFITNTVQHVINLFPTSKKKVTVVVPKPNSKVDA